MSEPSREQILAWIPHQRPFRFIDRILELSDEHVVASYTFRSDEFFYAGHFPEGAITPGVILTEAMVQMGMVPLGIRLLAQRESEPQRWITALTEVETEYYRPVAPDTTVVCRGKKIFWRRRKLKAELELRDLDDKLIAAATAGGVAAPRSAMASIASGRTAVDGTRPAGPGGADRDDVEGSADARGEDAS